MRRWLVTGASGFIGLRLARLLAASGDEVHAVVRTARSIGEGVITHRVDLLDVPAALRLADDLRPTHLAALAWTTAPGFYWTDPANARWVEATRALAERVIDRGAQGLVVAGSCAEYVWDGSVCREEATPLNPSTPYGAAKVALSKELLRECEGRGVPCAWARIFYAYGSGEPPEKIVTSLARSISRGEALHLREPLRRFDFVHAHDVASALQTLASSGATGAFNVGTGLSTSIEELAAAVARCVGCVAVVEGEPLASPGPDVVADSGKLRSAGWSPRYDAATGIAETLGLQARVS